MYTLTAGALVGRWRHDREGVRFVLGRLSRELLGYVYSSVYMYNI